MSSVREAGDLKETWVELRCSLDAEHSPVVRGGCHREGGKEGSGAGPAAAPPNAVGTRGRAILINSCLGFST